MTKTELRQFLSDYKDGILDRATMVAKIDEWSEQEISREYRGSKIHDDYAQALIGAGAPVGTAADLTALFTKVDEILAARRARS